MTPFDEECFVNIEKLISSTRDVTHHARCIIDAINRTDADHRSVGFTGMAHRAEVCKMADPPRWERLHDEYTDAAMETASMLVELHGLIVGIGKGLNETLAAKAEMEN